MKEYSILYSKCSYISEFRVRATSTEEAEKKFFQMEGDNSKILIIEEI